MHNVFSGYWHYHKDVLVTHVILFGTNQYKLNKKVFKIKLLKVFMSNCYTEELSCNVVWHNPFELVLNGGYSTRLWGSLLPLPSIQQALCASPLWKRHRTQPHADTTTCMHRSAKLQTPPNAVDSLWSCKGLWRGLSFVFSRSECHLTI